MGRRIPRRRLATAAVALVAACGLWSAVAMVAGAALLADRGDDRFDLVRWELTRLPRRYVHLAGALLRRESAGDRAALVDYFQTVGRLRELDASAGAAPVDTSERAALSDRATTLRPDAEWALEAELSRVIQDTGLVRGGPLTAGRRLVWPPVDVAFDDVPYVLAVARRDRIEIVRTSVLRPGLSPDDIARIEASVEQTGLSAIVEPLGGFAAYPSVVRVTGGAASAVETAAHEWVHHYLAFYPLGARYDASSQLTAVNETVADIAGRELAAEVRSRLELPEEARAPAPSVNVGAALRELRRDVDGLLARGDVAAAEARMRETQAQLSAAGYPLRRLNQAYLAFHNLYADAPASRNPIGPALRRLRRQSASLADFMAAVRDITSMDGLQRSVAESGTRAER